MMLREYIVGHNTHMFNKLCTLLFSTTQSYTAWCYSDQSMTLLIWYIYRTGFLLATTWSSAEEYLKLTNILLHSNNSQQSFTLKSNEKTYNLNHIYSLPCCCLLFFCSNLFNMLFMKVNFHTLLFGHMTELQNCLVDSAPSFHKTCFFSLLSYTTSTNS